MLTIYGQKSGTKIVQVEG